ncbi:hypothetical protein AAC387_Pa03g4122 [Persea americana]
MLLRRLFHCNSAQNFLGRFCFSRVGNYSLYTSQAATSLQHACETATDANRVYADYANVNWDELAFGLIPTDYMYIMNYSQDEKFSQGELHRYGNVELSPSAGVLNYGQGLFEGLKTYRKEDGRLLLFRPEQNALRMQMGAERMCMPAPSTDQFVNTVKQTVLANRRWVPPPGKGSLYVRPLLIGSGPILGLAPAPEYTFLIYASPVGNYFKVLKAQTLAKKKGYSDVIFLDSVNKRNLEEVSSCNIFVVKDSVISTPSLDGTILAGITRKSIIEIASEYGYQVEERPVPVEELLDADEVFCTGTAVVVAPVGSITYHGKKVEYKIGGQSISRQLYSALTSIQMGLAEDKMGWTVVID